MWESGWLGQYQVWIRFGIFLLVFALLATWETVSCWRMGIEDRHHRWLNHALLNLIGIILVRITFPLLTIGTAVVISEHHMGLLNATNIPFALKIVLGILSLDFVMYFQHRTMHKYTFLWRVHRVHHIDRFIDVSTGLRFHPLEELITTGFKVVGISFFGVPVMGVFLFEIFFMTAKLFTHINVRLSPSIDKILRKLFVTPSMHRIHHSDYPLETDSNYGFCFSWWDRLLGTYDPVSMSGERKLVFGVEEFRDKKYREFVNLLLIPFNIKSLKPRSPKRKKIRMKSY